MMTWRTRLTAKTTTMTKNFNVTNFNFTNKTAPLGATTLKSMTNNDLHVTTFRDLGNLCFSHIDKIASKANKVLGFFKRNCRDLRDISTLRTLFCVLCGHPLLPEILRCSKEYDVELQSLF